MPFKSKAQERWMFANKPEMAKQWAADTPSNTKLPERATKKNTKRKSTKKPKLPDGGHHQ